MAKKKTKGSRSEPPAPQHGHATGGELSDWGSKLEKPWSPAPAAATDEGAKKKKASAPSVMGFLSRVGGAPSQGKTPARGLLGKITAEDLKAVGRLGDVDEEAILSSPPAAPAEAPPKSEPPVATVEIAVGAQQEEAELGGEPPLRSAAERLKSVTSGNGGDHQGGARNRRSDRFPFEVNVEYRTVGRSSSETADNLSATGMFIHTATPLEVGDPVVVNFAVPEANFPLTFSARVKWVTAAGTLDTPVSGMGIEFTALDDKKRRALATIISRLRAGRRV